MKKTLPLVSIILVTYNGEKYLNYAINSILAQSFSNFELIIWDNGSTDNTLNIISSYTDPRIRLIKSPENVGIAPARSNCLQIVRGEFIAYCDDDDFYTRSHLQDLVTILMKNIDVGLVFCNSLIVKMNQPFYSKYKQPNKLSYFDPNGITTSLNPVLVGTANFSQEQFDITKNYIQFQTVAVMHKRECINKIGSFDENLYNFGEDIDYWLRISDAYKVVHCPKYNVVRIVDQNVSARRLVDARLYILLKRLSKKFSSFSRISKFLAINLAQSSIFNLYYNLYNCYELLEDFELTFISDNAKAKIPFFKVFYGQQIKHSLKINSKNIVLNNNYVFSKSNWQQIQKGLFTDINCQKINLTDYVGTHVQPLTADIADFLLSVDPLFLSALEFKRNNNKLISYEDYNKAKIYHQNVFSGMPPGKELLVL